jgi:Zn-dependent protease with chaperone function
LTAWYISFTEVSILLIAAIFRGLTWGMLYLFSRLLFRENRRAEYLADALAATISGSDSIISMLTKTNFGFVLPEFIKRLTETKRSDNIVARFRQYTADIPLEQFEDIELERQRKEALYALTHPPLAYRIDLLKLHPVEIPRISMTSQESADLHAEFAGLENDLNHILLQLQPNISLYL